MERIIIVVGSHTIRKSVSSYLAKNVKKILQEKEISQVSIVSVNQILTDTIFAEMRNSAVFILIAPIYIDLPPSKVLRWLEEIGEESRCNQTENNMKFFAVISNCGFYEAEHNELAIRIYKCFADKVGLEYIKGIGIGCGQLITNAEIVDNYKKIINEPIIEELNLFAQEIVGRVTNPNGISMNKNRETYVNFDITKDEYEYLTNKYWMSLGTKNGLSQKDYYNQPFNQMRKR